MMMMMRRRSVGVAAFLIALYLQAFLLQWCEAQDAGATAAASCDCTQMTEALDKEWLQRLETAKESYETDLNELQVSLDRANSLRKGHDESLSQLQYELERDKENCKHNSDSVRSLQEEIAKLQAENAMWKQQYQLVSKEKERVQQSKAELVRELESQSTTLRALTSKNADLSQNLVTTTEQLRTAEEKLSSTRINTKRIGQDLVTILQTIGPVVCQAWASLCDNVLPLVSKCMEQIEAGGRMVSETLSENTQFQDFLSKAQNFDAQHVQPLFAPMADALTHWHQACVERLSNYIENASKDSLTYLRMLQGPPQESKTRDALVRALEYSETHGDRVVRILERGLSYFGMFWILVGLVAWPRHVVRRRRQGLASGTQGKGSKQKTE